MSAPAVRIWTEHLLLLGPLRRTTPSAGRPQTFTRHFAHIQSRTPRATFGRSPLHILRTARSHVKPQLRNLRLKSDKSPHSPNPTPHLGSPEPAPSLSQRLKTLSKQYGWLAVGVYFGLSALDFPFCYLAVRMLGTERVGHYEHVVVESIKSLIQVPFPNLFKGSHDIEGPIAEEIREAVEREEAFGHDGAQVGGHNGGAEACMRPVSLETPYEAH